MTAPELEAVVERLDRLNRTTERMVTALESLAGKLPVTPVQATATQPEALWSVHQVAEFLRCSSSKIYKAAEAGRLPCVRDGRSLRFRPADIRAHVEKLAKQPVSAVVLPFAR